MPALHVGSSLASEVNPCPESSFSTSLATIAFSSHEFFRFTPPLTSSFHASFESNLFPANHLPTRGISYIAYKTFTFSTHSTHQNYSWGGPLNQGYRVGVGNTEPLSPARARSGGQKME
jgi:hypothetical protein